jgi:hypothetical protein
MRGRSWTVSVACLAGAGCGLGHPGDIGPPPQDPSASIGTDQLTPSFSAVDFGDGAGIHVTAALLAGDGNFVRLSTGDTLSATEGPASSQGTETPLTTPSYTLNDGSIHYSATLPSSPSSSSASPVTVALDRSQGTSAPDSSTVVPAPFTITTAPPGHVSSPHTYSMLISPLPAVPAAGSGESWEISASGDCIQDYVASTSDYTLTLNSRGELIFDTTKLNIGSLGVGCTLTLFVSHVHDGVYDPSFSGPVPGQSVDFAQPFASTTSFRGVQARAWDTVLLSP